MSHTNWCRKRYAKERGRTKERRLTRVNRCVKCGKPLEQEMLDVGSEQCADCVIAECERNGEWEE